MSAPVRDVSVVICTRGRPDLLVDTVASLFACDPLPREVVVVDQSAAKGPLDELDPPDGLALVHHHDRGTGLSRAINLGVRLATEDVLLFTHDDVLLAQDWVAQLADAVERLGPDGVPTGRVLAGRAELDGGHVPTVKEDTEPATYRGRIGADVLFPLNFGLHRATFERVGGFDERLGPGTPFPAAEDNDFGFRLLEAGCTLAYVPEAVVEHRGWRRDYFKLRWSYGTGQGGYYAKHLSLRDPYMLRRMGRDIAGRAAALPKLALTNRRRGLGNLVFIAALCAGCARWLVTVRWTRR
jgi:GT2 family glycosyltransferase